MLIAASSCVAASTAPWRAALAAPAAQQGATQQQPAIITVAPALVDLGVVQPGSTNPAKFTLINTGNMPVSVQGAVPNCKCTNITPVQGKVIAPGGTLEIEASLAAPRVPGEKEAVVFISFANAAPVQAKIKGEVRLPVLATPPYVDALRDVTSGTITLKATDGKPFTVLRSGGAAPVFVGFDPAKDAPRAEYRISWNLAGRTPEQMPLWWFVWTDRADCDAIPLRVRDEATGSKNDMERFKRFWIVKESLVMAGRGSVGAPHKAEIELEHYNPPKRGSVENPSWREVRGVKSLNPDVEVRFIGKRDAGVDGCMLEVEFTAKRAGPIEGLLEIETATGKGAVPFAYFATTG
ncbi:MAG: hypothetical protein RLY21_81 [Planctomycetota bacterium]|jgi:hypothetical protein